MQNTPVFHLSYEEDSNRKILIQPDADLFQVPANWQSKPQEPSRGCLARIIFIKNVLYACQKQNRRSSRFSFYVQHGKSGRPLVISLELQQCRDGVREIIPFTNSTAVLLMRSCIHMLQEKSITESATRQKAFGMRTVLLWAPDTFQLIIMTEYGDKQS